MLLGTSLIVFRESLEAALFVGVVAAAIRPLAQRGRWLLLGVAAGVAGSLILAASMEAIASWSEGLGQDLLSALILGAALLFLGWHAVDAPNHARHARSQAQRLGETARTDSRPLLAVSLAVSLAVLREGAETVLFVAGAASGSGAGAGELTASVLLGLSSGVGLGGLLYLGLARVQPARLFAVTNTLILLLAGALASQLVRTLSQVDWIRVLQDKAWDLDAWLPNDSVPGTLLHGLIGYDASPSQAQLLGYVAAVALIGTAARHARRQAFSPRNP